MPRAAFPTFEKTVGSIDSSSPYIGIRTEALRNAVEIIKAQLSGCHTPLVSGMGISGCEKSSPLPVEDPKSVEEIREEFLDGVKDDILSLASSFVEFIVTGKSL